MRPDLSKSYQSIETALHFAVEAEENLNYECTLLYNPNTPAGNQTYEVNALLDEWRTQKEICERLHISRQWFQILAKRPDFPAPVAAPGNRRIWAWADVATWQTQQQRKD